MACSQRVTGLTVRHRRAAYTGRAVRYYQRLAVFIHMQSVHVAVGQRICPALIAIPRAVIAFGRCLVSQSTRVALASRVIHHVNNNKAKRFASQDPLYTLCTLLHSF
jgi:hypothetical protein